MTKLYEKAAINSVTGDLLMSKLTTNAYRDGYANTFKYSFFEMNKLFKKQYVDLYNDGWALFAVMESGKEDDGVRVLLKNEFGDTIERCITI